MKIDRDDPVLTAYALGEIDERTRAEVEEALEESPECRQIIAEIRETAGALSSGLQNEPWAALTEEQRRSLDAAVKLQPVRFAEGAGSEAPPEAIEPGPMPSQRFWTVVLRNRIAWAGLAAACLALLITFSGIDFEPWKSPPLEESASVKQDLQNDPAKIQRNDATEVGISIDESTGVPTDEHSTVQPEPRPALDSQSVASAEIHRADVDGLPDRENSQPGEPFGPSSLVAAPQPAAPQAGPIPALDPNARSFSVPLSDSLTARTPTPGDRQNAGDAATGDGSVRQITTSHLREELSVQQPAPEAGTPTGNSGRSLDRTLPNRYGIAPVTPASRPMDSYRRATTADKPAAPTPTVRLDSRSGVARPPSPPADQLALGLASDGLAPSLATRSSERPQRLEQVTRERLGEPPPGRGIFPGPTSRDRQTAQYPSYPENRFLSVLQHPLSTFSIDVDTASYANVRRFLNQGQWPPRDAVRIEEMINYFEYDYPQPREGEPFSAALEVAGCPWNSGHRLVRVALQGRELPQAKRPPSNFVFLIDVSGSMQPAERLPLIKQALRLLVKRLTEGDRVAIVVYASNSGLVLPSTSGLDKAAILAAIDRLEAGGSTNGGEGIQLAYSVAGEHFIRGGVNRVVLCTDGDFNVGITDHDALVHLIQEKARSGVFLSALGVGTDNYKDALLQKLADKGNGNYHYLDSIEEAQKVLIDQMNATLVTIAKDVKIQIEFNPAEVSAYRLVGYEKRLLQAEDFNDDRKDAGEIGAGHSVTALYEIKPADGELRAVATELKYQPSPRPVPRPISESKEMLTLKVRYKEPDGNESKLLEFAATDSGASFSRASADFKFASAVASFGLLLRQSEHRGTATFDSVLEIAREGIGADESGYRAEFLNLARKAKTLAHRTR